MAPVAAKLSGLELEVHPTGLHHCKSQMVTKQVFASILHNAK
jgi:hypothetical protein